MSEKINLARYKHAHLVFELDVDPDKAMDFKQGKAELHDVLKSDKIFCDAKKGMLASEADIKKVFGTTDNDQVAIKIIKDGEIQLTEEYRNRIREQKKKQIVTYIQRNGVNPQTHKPYTADFLERAIDDTKLNIDFTTPVQDLINEAMKRLRVMIPIKFEIKEIEVHIPSTFAAKSYNIVHRYGKVLKEQWQNDGSLLVVVEMPGGLEPEFYDQLNALTHGNIIAKIINTR